MSLLTLGLCAVAFAATPVMQMTTLTPQPPATPNSYPGYHWSKVGQHTQVVYDWSLVKDDAPPPAPCPYAGDWGGTWDAMPGYRGTVQMHISASGAISISGCTAKNSAFPLRPFTGTGQISGRHVTLSESVLPQCAMNGSFGIGQPYGSSSILIQSPDFDCVIHK